MEISEILGQSYFSLEAATVDKSPEEVVVRKMIQSTTSYQVKYTKRLCSH